MDTLNGIFVNHVKEKNLIKSSYSEIIENIGIPSFTLTCSLHVIFPTLKFSSLKHLWDLIVVYNITKIIVREVIVKVVVSNKSGNKN